MQKQIVRELFQILELGGVILLFVFALGIVLPAPLPTILNVASYGILLLLIIGRWKHFAYVITTDKSLLLLVVFTVFSILWSEGESVVDAARGMIRTTIFGAYLAMRYTSREQMRLLSWVFYIAIVLSLLAGAFLPSYGTHVVNGVSSWRGVFSHKQDLGRFMSFAASLFLISALDKHSRWLAAIGLAGTLVLVKLSNSATGLLTFVFSLSILPFYAIVRQRTYRAFHLAVALLLSSIAAIVVTVNIQTIVVDYLGKDMEFNGRTPIWNLVIEKGLERPFLGYGYAGFWSSDAADEVLSRTWLGMVEEKGDNVDSGKKQSRGISHNGFLDLFLQLGLSGLILFIFNLSMLFARVFILVFATRNLEYFWMIVFIGINLVTNISDSLTILEANNIFWVVYVSVALSSSLELGRLRRKHKQMKDSGNLTVAT
ncbi:MAG: O-antigen ligase family protein [Fischerella sp.]|uniref:O-antigen ligase family protein n=1 Tax=Fischerella sp. TaxID=1191 RepID=UPI0017AE125A|nr:O-antigen ligase family protein [Fischerella sp.]NWF62005.1 O-antigen ligase family protein [Fischerella sp.]